MAFTDSFWHVLWHRFIIRSSMFVRRASQRWGVVWLTGYCIIEGRDRVNWYCTGHATCKPIDVRFAWQLAMAVCGDTEWRELVTLGWCHSLSSAGWKINRRSSIQTSTRLLKGRVSQDFQPEFSWRSPGSCGLHPGGVLFITTKTCITLLNMFHAFLYVKPS